MQVRIIIEIDNFLKLMYSEDLFTTLAYIFLHNDYRLPETGIFALRAMVN